MDMLSVFLYGFLIGMVGFAVFMVVHMRRAGTLVISTPVHRQARVTGYAIPHQGTTLEPATNISGTPMIPGTGVDVLGNPYGF